MATAGHNNTLPSLPLELRLKIFRNLLGSWEIPVEYCCNRIEKTTPARPNWSEEDAEKLGLFHVCHNIRATATMLIRECLKLTFDGGGCQECLDHDHARPLPNLLRNNVRHITLSLWDDHMDRSSIEAFSSLESVTFEEGYLPIDILHISWSRNWAVYVPSVKYQDFNLCQLAFDELVKPSDWMWDLYEDKSRKWRLIYKGGIHFPNIVGEETKTMRFDLSADVDANNILRKEFTPLQEPYSDYGNNWYQWTMAIQDIWELGDNARLDEIVEDNIPPMPT